VPSAALTRWQTDRMPRLGYMDTHCTSLLAPAPPAPAPAPPPAGPVPAPLPVAIPAAPALPPPLVQESLQGYVMLVSGHFQGFCRDLYTECLQICAAAVPPGLRTTIQAQFATELKLNTANPTIANIRKDFERFGFLLDLGAAVPGNPQRVTDLGHLNYWRNASAHQKATPPPAGVPAVLTLAVIQTWRASCDGLATSLDAIMRQELLNFLGVAPW
jgi:hypothetical protein